MNILEIADAVVDLLNNSSGLDGEFTAERKVLPIFDLKDLEALKVTVTPATAEYTLLNRIALTTDYQINIGIQKKVSADTDDDLETLIDFVESVVLFLKGKSLSTNPRAMWVKTVNEPIYSREHLAEQLVFTSIITITYKVIR